MPNLTTTHTNALAAGSTGTGAILLVALLGALGVALPPVAAAAIVAGASTLILLIGKKGIKGLVGIVWHGDETT